MKDSMPCEECILLAICITRCELKCQKLYTYLVTFHKSGDGWSTTDVDLRGLYWNRFRVQKLEARFSRTLMNLQQRDYLVNLGERYDSL